MISFKKVIQIILVVNFPTLAFCADGNFHGDGELEVFNILSQNPVYNNLHHNRWYHQGNLVENVFHINGGNEADIEFVRDNTLNVVELKSTAVSPNILMLTLNKYILRQLPAQRISYPNNTIIKLILDIRTIDFPINLRQFVSIDFANNGVEVGFLTENNAVVDANDNMWLP